MTLPTLFLSHGSPMLAITPTPAHAFLRALGQTLPTPDAILVVSAHWQAHSPVISRSVRPETLHDFGGFPEDLYALEYPASGAPALADKVALLLKQAGLAVDETDRGLDHGAWVPLRLMYPQAQIPVTQLSLVHGWGPAAHYRLGQALRPLRDENVLLIGSGSLTHNLRAMVAGDPAAAAAPSWVMAFADWMAEKLAAGATEELLAYRQLAPHAVCNHPSEEHLLPLFVALGAAGQPLSSERLHQSLEYGVLAMDAYRFGG